MVRNNSLPVLKSRVQQLSFGRLPAIPEVSKTPRHRYDKESEYRRDLLILASYNAAGLLEGQRKSAWESPEVKAKRALSEAKDVEGKIHSRVQYLVNQERRIIHKINRTRDSALKILKVKSAKENDAEYAK